MFLRRIHTAPMLLLLALLCKMPCFGQRDSIIINPVSYDFSWGYYYDSIELVPGVIYTIYSPAHYSNIDNLPLKLYSSNGQPITFRHKDGNPWARSGHRFEADVYSGVQSPTNLLGTVSTSQSSGLEEVYYVTQAGESLFLHSRGANLTDDTIDSRFEVFTCPGNENPYDVRIDEENRILLWSDSSQATSWKVWYENTLCTYIDSIVTNNTFIPLDNIYPGTYYFRISNSYNGFTNSNYCLEPHKFTISCSCEDFNNSCIDYTDLHSCATQGFYGNWNNLWQHNGIVDFGPNNMYSRHTVCTTDQTDPRTSYQLHTLPPSGAPSVRLGNWLSGGEAESLVYGMHVDSNRHNLLLVRYAIVFEEPGHLLELQPHVSLQIVDTAFNVIDPSCGAVDFYANQDLGWNNINDRQILWKDWSAIGLDLTSYHDQDIFVKIENYDCGFSAHYGYCYFAFECMEKIVKSDQCGPMNSTTFSAPVGFSYRWFSESNPDITLSLERTFFTNNPGTYYCQLSMPDGNTNCHFTLKTTMSDRYPWAAFSYQVDTNSNNCNVEVHFNDLSTVSAIENTLQDLHERVDSVSWDFGDGTISSERSPIHHYDEVGTYEVTLSAFLGNGTCIDDTAMTIVIPPSSPCTFDTIHAGICDNEGCWEHEGIRFCDTGTYDLKIGHQYLHIILSQDTTQRDYYFNFDLNNSQLPFVFNDESFTNSTSDSIIILSNQHGCDSVLHLTLNIHNDTTIYFDTTICKEDFPIDWNGYTFTQPQSFLQVGTGFYGQDSTNIYEAQQSEISAIIVASPQVVTSLDPVIQLSDAGNGVSRLWTLPDYTTSEQQFSYTYPIGLDTIPVQLIAYSPLGCSDTDFITLHILHEAIYAPNVFTPGQETNNRFYVQGEGINNISVSIFTREGLLVSQFSGMDGYWDGTATGKDLNAHGGTPCPQATYTYIITYTYITSPDHIEYQVGTVTLLR